MRLSRSSLFLPRSRRLQELTLLLPLDVRSCMKAIGKYMTDVIKRNPKEFRIFSPDELASNKLDGVFDATTRCFQPDPLTAHIGGRVTEMLSEHTLQGWLQGYTLTGRHGVFPSYEAFLGIIATMMVQYSASLFPSLSLALSVSGGTDVVVAVVRSQVPQHGPRDVVEGRRRRPHVHRDEYLDPPGAQRLLAPAARLRLDRPLAAAQARSRLVRQPPPLPPALSFGQGPSPRRIDMHTISYLFDYKPKQKTASGASPLTSLPRRLAASPPTPTRASASSRTACAARTTSTSSSAPRRRALSTCRSRRPSATASPACPSGRVRPPPPPLPLSPARASRSPSSPLPADYSVDKGVDPDVVLVGIGYELTERRRPHGSRRRGRAPARSCVPSLSLVLVVVAASC